MAKAPTQSDATAPEPATKTTTKKAAAPAAKKPKPTIKKDVAAKKPKPTVKKDVAVKKPKSSVTANPKTADAPKPKERSLTILQLAADIIADRIIPTIEQIKSIALSAMSHETTKDKKAKAKKKKK